MANTKNAVLLDGSDWQDVSILTGIPVGTALDIQNQSTSYVQVAINATKPVSTFRGFVIPPNPADIAAVDAGEDRVWIIGKGRVSIQEG